MPAYFISTKLTFLQVIKELSAQVIFTAHDHRARRVTFDVTSEQLSEIRPFPKSPKYPTFYQLRLDMDEVHEFQVPTCSYRMGTADMGYGFALIGKKSIKQFIGKNETFE